MALLKKHIRNFFASPAKTLCDPCLPVGKVCVKIQSILLTRLQSIPPTQRVLKSSTLVETLTAINILNISFALAIMVFLKVVNSSKLMEKHKATQRIEEVVAQTRSVGSFFDENIDFRTFRIQKEVVEEHSRQLLVMSFKALDEENKVIAEQKHLFYTELWGK